MRAIEQIESELREAKKAVWRLTVELNQATHENPTLYIYPPSCPRAGGETEQGERK
jgi:hypothetical protein